MKKSIKAISALAALCMTLSAVPVSAYAAKSGPAPVVSEEAAKNGRIVISNAGEYTLTGKMTGTVYIEQGAGDVVLILDNAEIDGGSDAAIVQTGGNLTIKAVKGTVNTVRGEGGSYGAVVYCKKNITVGEGRLNVISGPDAAGFRAKKLNLGGGSISVSGKKAVYDNTMMVRTGGNILLNGEEIGTATGAADTVNENRMISPPPVSLPDSTSSYPADDQIRSDIFENVQKESQAPEDMNDRKEQPPADMNGQKGQLSENMNGQKGQLPENMNGQNGQPPMGMGGQDQSEAVSTVDTPTMIAEGITENSAMSLEADTENATAYTLTDENGTVTVSEPGTYIITGSSSDGGITVKKGTTGIVLILEDLDLTSTSGAALSVNKNAEVQIVVTGTVTLTDAEDPDDENSEDAETADAFDGAAIKIKADSVVFVTGDGELNINGNAKNGIKAGDNSSLVIGGDVTVNITAANDGINTNYDLAILDGDITISAGGDAIHSDRILTVGSSGTSPDITITKSEEGLEGTAVNIRSGNITVNSADDGINAANSDAAYEDELDYAINITGGNVIINAGGDGLDSNGNINLTGGSAAISSANNGGEAGIDYDGEFYISDDFELNNNSGVAGPDNMMPGGMPGDMPVDMQGGMNGQPGKDQGTPPAPPSGTTDNPNR